MGRFGIRPCTIKKEGMILFDIHTHNEEAAASTAILNCRHYRSGRVISMGIHPWHIEGHWQEELHSIETAAGNSNVAAIGECGIDRLKSTASAEIQEALFRAHAQLAEKVQKPLIIHCVKAIGDIIALRKEIKPEQPWIIHGFRGKPQQAEQLAKAGFHLSLGEHFNPLAAKSIPADRLFIESDESSLPILDICKAVAAAKEMNAEELARQMAANARIFGFREFIDTLKQ